MGPSRAGRVDAMSEGSSHETDVMESTLAVIGLSGRFAGANHVETFWQNIRNGVESIQRYNDSDLLEAGVPRSLLEDPDYVNAGAPLRDMEKFDGGFFGFTPLDSSIMDPQHRHFLECAWEAFESAGHDPDRFEGAIGVWAGSGHNAYFAANLLSNPELVDQVGHFLLRHTGNDKDFLATRVSYELNLTGPSVNVQTACSTSLVAIHMASQSLLAGECEMALAGGVTIELPHRQGYVFREGEILSPDGHCRVFDANSRGTIFGSGVGAVVLRRLEDALEDGDQIFALIRGSAINNDGASKIGYLAPSVEGQAKAIHEALSVAEISPASIQYVECHGTGTAVGDPIEIAALTEAYRQGTDAQGFCAVGSVKPNIGHTDTAAGVASFIKAVQALRHREIPPCINFTSPNPEIDFQQSPFFVNAQTREWAARGDEPRRAAVNSLGVGGTNAHLILEEAPERLPSSDSRPWQLLVVSGRSENSLDEICERLAERLREDSTSKLADVAHTLRVGRRRLDRRRAIVCRDTSEAAELLESQPVSQRILETAGPTRRSVAFMFPGGGAQYPGMGQDLYESEPVYRQVVDDCFSRLEPALASELRPLLWPQPGQMEWAAQEFERPSLQLPALFICELALARLWMSWGIKPDALIGHSMGENTAACLAGVFELKDALGLVCLRGRLFESVPEGAMLSIPLAAEQVEAELGDSLSLASVNAPELCAASGPIPSIESLEARLESLGVESRRIKIQIAAHSAMLDPILDEWAEYLAGLQLRAPQIPFISNRTGTWITSEQATDPQYWVDHLRGTVLFEEGVRSLCSESGRILLEVGPGRTLSSLAQMHPERVREQAVLHSLRHPEDDTPDLPQMLKGLGRLWAAGVDPDWDAFAGEESRVRLALPTYPWEHQRHWIQPGLNHASSGSGTKLERLEDLDQWFQAEGWRRLPPPVISDTPRPIVLWAGPDPLTRQLTEIWEAMGHTVWTVTAGREYQREAANRFVIRSSETTDYHRLLGALEAAGALEGEWVYLWNLVGGEKPTRSGGAVTETFDSLFRLARGLAESDPRQPLRLHIYSRGLRDVGGEAVIDPLAALALGPGRVLSHEMPGIQVRHIDLGVGEEPLSSIGEKIVGETLTADQETDLALRGGQRFTQGVTRLPLSWDDSEETPPVREGGLFVITGGLGGLGLVLARYLGTRAGARIILIGRSPLPLDASTEHSDLSTAQVQRIREIREIQAAGAIVESIQADVCDSRAIGEAIRSIKARHGAIHGVVHAAGALDDDLLINKKLQAAHHVLNPKVQGTLALWEALEGDGLDFFWLYSSVSAAAGLPGQSDYVAANAFLDAFAQAEASRGQPVLSIAWGPWRDAGMAAQLNRAPDKRGEGSKTPLAHPFLQEVIFDSPKQKVFSSKMGPQSSWLLNDHRLAGGEALIPGTGFVEMARAAISHSLDGRAFELREMFLALPLIVEDDGQREIRVVLERDEGQFSIISRQEGAPWVDHVRGEFVPIEPTASEKVDLQEVRSRCSIRTEVFEQPPTSPHLRFGPRWGCLKSVHFGATEALAELELSEQFTGDLDQIGAHPALLDLATGCAHDLIEENEAAKDFFVPMGYGRFQLADSLPPRLMSHIRYVTPDAPGSDVVFFQITLYDPSGTELGHVDDFMLKRVSGEQSLISSQSEVAPATHVRMFDDASGEADANQGIMPALQHGIRSEDAPLLFNRLLGRRVTGRVTVLPCDVAAWLDAVRPAPSEHTAPDTAEDPILQADLNESRAALLECEGIEDAWVTAHFDRPGERRLLGHVVFRSDHSGTISEIRKGLRKKLSSDLVPQNFSELTELPRTRAGVIDTSALEDPFGLADDFEAPRSDSEKAVAEIWKEVLGIDRVGLYDNFFDSGGHSLLAMRVIVRSEKRLGVKLNNAMMVLQTLEQIAAEVDKQTGAATVLDKHAEAGEGSGKKQENPESGTEPKGLSRRLIRAVRRTVKAD